MQNYPRSCTIRGLAVVLCAASAPAAMADSPPAIPAPPYHIAMERSLFVGVAWDPAKLRAWLPAGVRPVAESTGGIAIYTSHRGFGISPYQAVYFYADIEGFDSASGMKGRWMIQGGYGPDDRLSAALRGTYRWPVRTASVRYEDDSSSRSATGLVAGREVLQVSVRPATSPCDRYAGVTNYVSSASTSGRYIVNEIPWEGPWCNVEPVAVKITAPSDDPIAALVPAKILWAAEFSGATVTFTKPLTRP